MNKLTKHQELYLTDDIYLPIQYKGVLIQEPNFNGNGNHSVADLEKIINQYKEYSHQQKIIKQNCMKHIVELKFNLD